ncbi:phospholipase D-like domain-containing protein [Actinoplanes regularis]|uniref:Phosphatidylserine/phosphatidylglycerophosphate/cardiolipin synthase n=1 Tax=Actinoplanes regularis TaxID=52697 RepID=A0A239F1T0_9ACTN|nr:phospholipase D-like domain-containing protein [Actinoplanes regularis]SNS50886.1 Phosphatidylserine/phosphatidylglycerophosphate/cardiolipin synthase [Actinoplanes regularis]
MIHRSRRRRRPMAIGASVLVALAAALAVPATSLTAWADSQPAGTVAETPHLDAVEQALRQVAPGLDGSVWQRTDGNQLVDPGTGAAGDGWVLQTPGCWGDPACTDRAGTRRLLAGITATIAKATRTVDISSLAPLPNGAFQDAIVAGLKAAATRHQLRVRILVGAVPGVNLNVVPSTYRNELAARLGADAANVSLNVASVTTSKTGFSWNHSKILVVDGATAIVGGINDWKDDYLDTTHPVTDLDMAVTGPAARSAGGYLDTLWAWTCGRKWDPAYVWFAASSGASCMASMQRDAHPAPVPGTGSVPVIAVGGLGIGITSGTGSGRLAAPPADTKCGVAAVYDYTNTDAAYDSVNPEETALRTLIGSATSRIDISQQDLNGVCPPLPRYDVRLYDVLAAKLAAGVKVRIVVSDPRNHGTAGSGGYSQIESLAEISDVLRNRLALRTGDQQSARAAMCRGLQLASFRGSDADKWADGQPHALHHKVVSVDGAAFYIGSKNLYPAWLQDFGYIVEDRTAAGQLAQSVLDPEWRYSSAAATVDYARQICPQ